MLSILIIPGFTVCFKFFLHGFRSDLAKQNATLLKEVARLRQINGLDSNNSGIPTSQTSIAKEKRIPNSRTKTGKSKGGQKGHKRHTLKKFKDEEVNCYEEHELSECPCCHGAVKRVEGCISKDEYDYQVVLIKRRHTYPFYECTECHKIVKAPIPTRLKEENQYGVYVQSMALSFMNEGNVSINKTKQMISGFTDGGISPSEGYLAKLQSRIAKILTPFSEDLRKHLLTQPLLYWDDTVIKVNKKRACLRFYGNEKLALFKAHLQKNKEGVLEDQLLQYLDEHTTVMHDHNTLNYNEAFSYINAECNVHLLRDMQACIDNTQHKWPKKLKTLLHQRTKDGGELLKEGVEEFSLVEITGFNCELRDCLILAEKEHAETPSPHYEQKERALIKRLYKYEVPYFSWVMNFDFPFSNNESERSLRGVKSKLKISGQFQNITAARNYATIRSYTETCKRHGINVMEALQRAAQGNPYTLTEVLNTIK